MKNIIEILEGHYNSFINLENHKDFFGGLKDYFELIDSVPELDRISDKLLTQEKPFEEKVELLKPIALKKISEVQKEILGYILKNKINNERINNLLNEYGGRLNGRIAGSQNLPLALHEQLCDIISILYQIPEHKDFASHYIEFFDDKKIMRRYFSLKELDNYVEAESELKNKYKNELWGQMVEICQLYQVIKSGEEKRKELINLIKKEDSTKARYELMNYNIVFGEWKSIEENRADNPIFFDVKKIRLVITRFQNYLLRELATKTSSSNKQNELGKDVNEKVKIIEKRIIAKLESKQKQNNRQKNTKIVLYLSKRGELWREPKKNYCYPIEEKSDRHRIIRYFVENKIYDYFPTQQIANNLELTPKNLSNQIGNIRSITSAKLKLKQKIIDGVKDSGYKINPNYKIIPK